MDQEPMTLSEEDRRLVGLWAADCAERVLPLFEAKALEEANQSNDPARMRAANDQAMKALAEMKNHMSMCMNMMDMMEKMHGKGQKKQ